MKTIKPLIGRLADACLPVWTNAFKEREAMLHSTSDAARRWKRRFDGRMKRAVAKAFPKDMSLVVAEAYHSALWSRLGNGELREYTLEYHAAWAGECFLGNYLVTSKARSDADIRTRIKHVLWNHHEFGDAGPAMPALELVLRDLSRIYGPQP